MCGINVIYSNCGLTNDQHTICEMNSEITHRGHDSEGYFYNNNIHLGMRRLSVIDLSTGNQPVYNEDKSVVVVFNGEIYNFPELKQKLQQKGHLFHTNSDTEVLVHAYEQWGNTFPQYLNGMFAFALYDIKKSSLFIARDRLGKKPLYYAVEGERVLISSELKSILKVKKDKLQISKDGLNLFFSLTFIPSPYTIYEGIRKLPPATFAVITDHKVEPQLYWSLAEVVSSQKDTNGFDNAKSEIKELFYDSVKKRIVSDVPLGAFLSGGVDSSIVVATMADILQEPVRTFTIRNSDSEYDESGKARVISKLFNTAHTEWEVNNNYLVSILEKCIQNFDEPFADSSALPSFVVSELARREVTVVLTGDGGDELFGGYTRYLFPYYLNIYSKIPVSIRKNLLLPILNSLPALPGLKLKINRIRKLGRILSDDPFVQYTNLQSLGYTKEQLGEFMNFPLPSTNEILCKKNFDMIPTATLLQKCMFNDTIMGLEGDMLAKVDRTAMQNSIEVRCPFLDSRLVEAAFRLPDDYKIKKNQTKYILKHIFKDKFPNGFLNSPKMGFGIPIGDLLKKELFSQFMEILNPEYWGSLSELFNFDYLKKLFRNHCSGIDSTFQLWTFYVFSLWYCKNRDRIYM